MDLDRQREVVVDIVAVAQYPVQLALAPNGVLPQYLGRQSKRALQCARWQRQQQLMRH